MLWQRRKKFSRLWSYELSWMFCFYRESQRRTFTLRCHKQWYRCFLPTALFKLRYLVSRSAISLLKISNAVGNSHCNWHYNVIYQRILEERRISTKRKVEILDIFPETVGYNITTILDMRKLSAKWMSKSWKGDQRKERVQTSKTLLAFIQKRTETFWLC